MMTQFRPEEAGHWVEQLLQRYRELLAFSDSLPQTIVFFMNRDLELLDVLARELLRQTDARVLAWQATSNQGGQR